MRWWVRPVIGGALVVLVAASCSGGDESGATTTTTTTSSTTTTRPLPTTTTTTLPPVIITSQPGTFIVTDFGAIADGKNNDSPAFQAAVDAAAVEGGIVVVPAVGGRRSYVLNNGIDVPSGVSIVGAPAGTGLDVAGPYPWPDTNINGVKLLARPVDDAEPLFRLGPGTTIRGLWITYDQRPFPTNDELVDEDGDYGYFNFGGVRNFFLEEHVPPSAPTFYIEDGSQTTIQDVIADRYYDFLYMKRGGPLRVDGVTLYGYHHGFTIEDSPAVNTFTNITFAPIVGPFAPAVPDDLVAETEDEHSWVFGAIATNPDNVGFRLGRSDGFVMNNVAFSAGHTAIQLGASFDYPIIDPLSDEFFTSIPGLGPWGQMQDVRIQEAAVAFHLVAPSANTIQMGNVSAITGIADGVDFAAVDGSGSIGGVARQGFMVADLTYAAAANGSPPTVPAILATNIAIGSVANERVFTDAAARIDETNGRVFLIDGDIGMEINGFSLAPPLEEALLIASGASADEVSIRIRGILVAGRPEADKLVEKDGVTVLTGDILVIQPPPPPPTTSPPDTTTTTGAPAGTTTTTAAPPPTTTTTAAPPPTTTTAPP